VEATETGRSAVGISLFRPALSHFEMIAGYYQARFYQECAELYREMFRAQWDDNCQCLAGVWAVKIQCEENISF
jgi:hypothetical protein